MSDQDDEIARCEARAAEAPDDPRVIFALGGAYDAAGREADAIPHYRRAIELGLGGDDLPRVAVQLGSSLRNVGEHAEAVRILADARRRFPDHRALRMFYALALHDAGRPREALHEALDLVLDVPGAIDEYRRSLSYYVDELRGRCG